MDQDTVTNPTDGSDAPEIDTEVTQQADDTKTAGLMDADELDPDFVDVPQDDDLEDVDWEGARYRIPKALKPAIMMNADYTRKTQELADHRRSLDGERERFNQQVKSQQESFEDRVQLALVDRQLQQFQKIDWDKLQADDYEKAQSLWRNYQMTKDARNELAGRLRDRDQRQAFETQQATAKRLEEGHAVLTREIPNWSPETAKQLTAFGVSSLGFSAQELSGVSDPRYVKTLYLAQLGQKWLDKQRAAARTRQPQGKPVSQVGTGRARAGKDEDSMSTEEWMDHERKRTLKKA